MKKQTGAGAKKWTCPLCGVPNEAVAGREPRCVGCGFVVEEFGVGPPQRKTVVGGKHPVTTKRRTAEAKNASNRWTIAAFIGVIILIVAIAVLFIAKLNLIPNSPSGVVLKTTDLPTGWQENSYSSTWEAAAGTSGLDGAYVRVFTPEGKSSPTVTSVAVKFKSSASSFFGSMKQLYGTSASHQKIGDGSFIENRGHTGFFWEKDFFVMLEITAENIENTGLRDIAYYLGICEGRTYWPW